jgi:hypothetical protein
MASRSGVAGSASTRVQRARRTDSGLSLRAFCVSFSKTVPWDSSVFVSRAVAVAVGTGLVVLRPWGRRR